MAGIALLGTCVPLITLLGHALASSAPGWRSVAAALAAALIGGLLTLYRVGGRPAQGDVSLNEELAAAYPVFGPATGGSVPKTGTPAGYDEASIGLQVDLLSDARVRGGIQLERELRSAIAGDQLTLYYQPQVSLRDGRIVGVEALLRWHHPTRGILSPREFMPAAARMGLSEPIGEWVLRTACQQHRAWNDAGLPAVKMAINLAADQLRSYALVEMVGRVIDETAIEPSCLELEVTESALLEHLQVAIHLLTQLRDMGVTIALDDFGTGYSSLNYLKRFPIDTLKIDPSFVHGIAGDPGSAAIANAMIVLAHTLGLDVLAEGVETADQRDYLTAHGCDKAQGYFLSRPLPADLLIACFEEQQILAA